MFETLHWAGCGIVCFVNKKMGKFI